MWMASIFMSFSFRGCLKAQKMRPRYSTYSEASGSRISGNRRRKYPSRSWGCPKFDLRCTSAQLSHHPDCRVLTLVLCILAQAKRRRRRYFTRNYTLQRFTSVLRCDRVIRGDLAEARKSRVFSNQESYAESIDPRYSEYHVSTATMELDWLTFSKHRQRQSLYEELGGQK
jgi:hypothetical protein